jgi:hypothetical protein
MNQSPGTFAVIGELIEFGEDRTMGFNVIWVGGQNIRSR